MYTLLPEKWKFSVPEKTYLHSLAVMDAGGSGEEKKSQEEEEVVVTMTTEMRWNSLLLWLLPAWLFSDVLCRCQDPTVDSPEVASLSAQYRKKYRDISDDPWQQTSLHLSGGNMNTMSNSGLLI